MLLHNIRLRVRRAGRAGRKAATRRARTVGDPTVTAYSGYVTIAGTATGQWFISGDGLRWWFDSGSLALDFAYTGDLGDNEEVLLSPKHLTAWLDGRFEGMRAEQRDLVDALALRSAIANVARAVGSAASPTGTDIDVINLYAATPDIPPSLAGGTRQAGRSTARASQALSVIARQAVALFSDSTAERFRACAAEDCELVFYDESRSNNRRWCSMQRCGNRAKVRAHRLRSSS